MTSATELANQSNNFKLINERYPHIAQKIGDAWGQANFYRHVEDLIRKSFGGARSGFSEQVEDALKALIEEHKDVFESESKLDPKSALQNSLAFKRLNSHYERLAKIVADLWGSEVLSPYITKLLNSSKDGQRQGFPPEIAEALISLMTDHERKFPHTREKNVDKWDSNLLR